MKLMAPIAQLKKLPKNSPVSYGRSFVTQRDTLLGVVPLGYADGYWRCFSNRAVMRLNNAYVPVVGRVCMDQLLIDVTDIADVREGQMVTIIDDEPASPCSAYALAELADTICYEILTSVHAHVTRIVR
jgi:alanine racemase